MTNRRCLSMMFILAIFSTVINLAISFEPASAISANIINDTDYYNLRYCYNFFSKRVDVQTMTGWSDELGFNKKVTTPNTPSNVKGQKTCEDVIKKFVNGGNDISFSDANSVRTVLGKLGYEPGAVENAVVKCVHLKYRLIPEDRQSNSYEVFTPTICANVDSNSGEIVRGDESWSSGDSFIWINDQGSHNDVFNVRTDGWTIEWNMYGQRKYPNSNEVSEFTCSNQITATDSTWDEFMYHKEVRLLWVLWDIGHNGVQSMGACTDFEAYNGDRFEYLGMEFLPDSAITTTNASYYTLPDNAFDTKFKNKIRTFKDNEILEVYKSYLDNSNWVDKYCGTDDGQISRAVSEGGTAIKYIENGKQTTCVMRDKGVVSTWRGFTEGKGWERDITFAEILAWFDAADMEGICKSARLPDWNKANSNLQSIFDHPEKYSQEQLDQAQKDKDALLAIYNPDTGEEHWVNSDGTCAEIPGVDNTPIGEEDPNDPANPLNTVDPQGDQEPSNLDICMNSAEGLGWILCLIVDALEGVVSAFYDGVIEPMLAIDSDFFADGNETYEAWNIFRNIANIFFVILLLIVILSQVTGYGIDNYGIKKILPKLIITAILVNLSYFICSLAVDVSNILGSGLRTMLGGIAGGATINEGGDGGFMYRLVSDLLVLGIGAGTVVAFIASPGIIISIVVALLGALISIFFMLVALGARMVGVIILLVISPLALVLYALPNTSKVFDKWFSAFKAVLLVYPICGALVGGGQFASRLILGLVNGNDIAAFFYTLLAMLVGVLPFFAIPTLLKSSMAALGNIGAKISSVGAGLSRGTQNTIRGSELYKRGVTSANNLDIGGMKTKLANTKFGRATGYSGIRARQIAAANKMKSDDRAAGVELEDEILNRMERADPTRVSDKALKERVRRAAADGDQDKTFAAFEAYASRVGASKASNDAIEIFDDLQAANGGAGAGVMAGEHRGEFLRDMAKNQAFSKAPDWQRYAAASGRDADGNNVRFAGQRGDGSYMGSVFKPGDLKSDQVVGAGAASMSRILSSGAVSQAEAQSIMASQDNWDKMDATQKLIMQAYAEHNDVLSKEQAEELLKPPEPGTTGYTLRLSAPQDYNYKYANALIAPRPQNVNIAGQTATLKIEHGGGTP